MASQASTVHDAGCGDKNCPRHGERASASRKFESSTNHSSEGCQDKNCPKHGSSAEGLYLAGSRFYQNAKAQDSKVKAQMEDIGHELDGMIRRTKVMVTLSLDMKGAAGNNNNSANVVNRNIPSASMPPKPIPMPSTSKPQSPSYEMMKKLLDHALKENDLLKTQNEKLLKTQNETEEENVALRSQMKDLQEKLKDDQDEKLKMKEMLKRLTVGWETQILKYQKTIEVLQSKIRFTDLKAKQLKRMASENAATANKWRQKAMEALQAQQELEERRIASEKATVGIYQKLRDDKKKVMELRKQGVNIPATPGGDWMHLNDSTASSDMSITLNKSFFQSPPAGSENQSQGDTFLV